MPEPLTARQRAVYDFLRDYIHARGLSPSIAEIAEAMGVNSMASVYGRLEILTRKGWIVRLPGRARSVRLISQHCPTCQCGNGVAAS